MVGDRAVGLFYIPYQFTNAMVPKTEHKKDF
jgi:hypothetical protein